MSEHHHHPPHPEDGGSPPPTLGTHGMLIIGERNAFLSHLPMFMFDAKDHPHNFQVIMRVTFEPPAGGGAAADYFADHKQHPEMRLYTFVPDVFEMNKLDPGHRAIDSLTGEVHRGHFERHGQDGGKAIGRATAKISGMVLFRPFERGARKPGELEYLLFGHGGEQFLAHLIVAPPDFDHVVSLREREGQVTPDELAKGILVRIPGRPNSPKDRLKAGERVSGRIPDGQDRGGRDVDLDVNAELYFEEGELGEPSTLEQTREENKAGF
jgi:hypothetical protein